MSNHDSTLQLSVIVPAVDETVSLEKTVEVVIAENASILSDLWIVLGPPTTAACRHTAATLMERFPQYVHIGEQRRPRLGGALRDGFSWARGTHVLMMAADLETPPEHVKDFVAAAQEGWDIVTATRWRLGGGFEAGYSRPKYLLNWGFQKMFSRLYGTPLSDLTYGYRLLRKRWVQDVAYQELGHPFLVETLLKPLRLGATAKEIPCTWRVRQEGKSNSSLRETFAYVPTVIRTRLMPRNKLLRQKAP